MLYIQLRVLNAVFVWVCATVNEKIGDEGAARVAEALRACPQLQSLNLSRELWCAAFSALELLALWVLAGWLLLLLWTNAAGTMGVAAVKGAGVHRMAQPKLLSRSSLCLRQTVSCRCEATCDMC